MPDSANASLYMPTYYVSEALWQNAYSLHVDGRLFGVDIQMLPLPVVSIGIGTLSGYVSFTDSSEYETDFYNKINCNGIYNYSKSNLSVKNPAQNIAVLLNNNNGETINWTLSNNNGYFEFNDLAYGKYKVLAQKPGYALSNIPIITLTNDNLTTLGENIKVYPNPVINNLVLELNPGKSEKINIILYSTQGQIAFDTDVPVSPSAMQKVTIPVSNMATGLYFGRAISNNMNKTFKFIKTTN
jgi:hypothetical protein